MRQFLFNQGSPEGAPGGGETFELKGPDQVLKVTRDQLLADAQKGRFVLPEKESELTKLQQSLEDIKSKAEAGEKLGAAIRGLVSDDETAQQSAVETLAGVLDLSEEEVAYLLKKQAKEEDEETPPAARRKPARVADDEDEVEEVRAPKTLTLDGLRKQADPSLRRILDEMNETIRVRDRAHLEKETMRAIESHEILGKFKENRPEALPAIQKLALRELARKIVVDGADAGPQTYREIAAEVAGILDQLGIRPEKDLSKTIASMGLGPIASAFGDEFLRDSGNQGTRVRIGDPGRSKYLASRLAKKVRANLNS